MDLTGTWRAQLADDGLRRSFAELDFDDDEWVSIEVPGHWQSHNAFRAVDGPVLFRRRFRTAGLAEDQRVWLHLAGLFYMGDVWLDGRYLGATEGYFFTNRFEISDDVAARDEHVLAIEVTSPRVSDPSAKRAITGAFGQARHLDPFWNPGGIWRPVSTYSTGMVALQHFRVVCTEADANEAELLVRAVVDTDRAQTVTFHTRVCGVEHSTEQPLAAGENRVEWTVEIPEPELWWPHSLGDQPLHEVEVDVILPDGTWSDGRIRRTGLRRIEMKNWVLSVNDERLFLKGINVGPTRQGLADATDAELRADVAAARDLGADFIRVHSHVSRPALYEAADELGMLVWQDFPLHGGYDRGVREEAGHQAREMVDALSHHPSIAIWCGHDDPYGHRVPATMLEQQLPTWNRSILDRSVKRSIARSDPSRPVIAHSGVLPHLPQLDGTDSHLWFGWETGAIDDLSVYIKRLPRAGRFVSEFGAESVPDSDAFCEPDRWPNLDWERLQRHHNLSATLLRHFPPEQYPTFDAWSEATQRFQALLLKQQIEQLRRLKYRPTGGLAPYLLADGHPAVSASLLDHRRKPKLAYAAVRDAFRPVLPIADPFGPVVTPGDSLSLDVHVVNDRRVDLDDAEITATIVTLAGDTSQSWGGSIPADDVVRVGTVEWMVPFTPGVVELRLDLRFGDEKVANTSTARIPVDVVTLG